MDEEEILEGPATAEATSIDEREEEEQTARVEVDRRRLNMVSDLIEKIGGWDRWGLKEKG